LLLSFWVVFHPVCVVCPGHFLLSHLPCPCFYFADILELPPHGVVL
jgi:hypothetical protein